MSRNETNNNTSISNFVSRALHVGLTIGIFLVLVFTNTVLKKSLQDGHIGLLLLFSFATAFSIILYLLVSLMDPGFVKETDVDVKPIALESVDSDDGVVMHDAERHSKHQHDNSNFTSEDIETEAILQVSDDNSSLLRKIRQESNQRCGFCGLEKPIRARHCRECKHCVRKFDHHCPWVANCIGERNHRWFWLFLAYESCMIVWSIYISVTGYTASTNSQDWLKNNILLLLTDVLLAVFFLVVISLCCIHTYMAVSNHTTWESMSRHRITYLQKIEVDNPFSLGYCRNAYVFLCYCKPYNWKTIYQRKVAKATGSNSHENNI